MDDNQATTLHDSQHEWAGRLTRILHPLIYEGINGMFKEATEICKKANENGKYLMTFQNILYRIPKWNESIIQTETERIITRSGCTYLDDFLTCVHIAQLKILTSIRTGKAQKKVDIDIPKLSTFIHNVYISVSKELYLRTYLFQIDVAPLVYQEHRNEINVIIKTSMLNVIRDSIPVEQLLRAYLDETTDLIKEKEAVAPIKKEISFTDKDNAITVDNEPLVLDAPKDIPSLEKLAAVRLSEQKEQEAQEDAEFKLKITNEILTPEFEDLTVKPLVVVDPLVAVDPPVVAEAPVVVSGPPAIQFEELH